MYKRQGKGSVCFDQLTFQPLPVDDGTPLTGKASASVAFPAGAAALAIDGKTDTCLLYTSRCV